jgi:hypothetical protein
MTGESAVADRVAEMHTAMAQEPPNELAMLACSASASGHAQLSVLRR